MNHNTCSPLLAEFLVASPSPRTVFAAGDIDIATAPALLDEVMAPSASGSAAVVVDFTALTFVGAATLTVLISARNQLNSHGTDLSVRHPTPRLAWMLELFGLSDLLEASRTHMIPLAGRFDQPA